MGRITLRPGFSKPKIRELGRIVLQTQAQVTTKDKYCQVRRALHKKNIYVVVVTTKAYDEQLLTESNNILEVLKSR